MALVTLVAQYLSTRAAAGGAWFVENDIPLTQPNMQLVTIAMSAVTMQWAVWAISRDDRYHAYMALGLTLVTGNTREFERIRGLVIENWLA